MTRTETCQHEWTEDEDRYACTECDQTCPACNVCTGPTGSSLLACQRCLDREAGVLDSIADALSHYLPPMPVSVGVMRYDRDRRGPSSGTADPPLFDSPADVEGVLWSWAGMWTEASGQAANLDAVDYLRSRLLWAAHHAEDAAWDDYRHEMRTLLHHARRLAGLLPQRQTGACIYCGGIVVRSWADDRWQPRADGLSDELCCSRCRTTWENPQSWRLANRHTILALPETHPDHLVTREHARSIFPEVPSGTWRSWIHRDAQRGEAQRRWREYIEPDEHGRVRIGPAPEPERMPVRAWDVRGDALYRLGDLTEHVEERRGDARRGPKAKERRAG